MIPSNFISQPQETPSNPIIYYFLPFPQHLSHFTEEQLLPICITLIPDFPANPALTNRINNNDLALIFIAT